MFNNQDQKFLVELVSYFMGIYAAVSVVIMLLDRLLSGIGRIGTVFSRKVKAE